MEIRIEGSIIQQVKQAYTNDRTLLSFSISKKSRRSYKTTLDRSINVHLFRESYSIFLLKAKSCLLSLLEYVWHMLLIMIGLRSKKEHITLYYSFLIKVKSMFSKFSLETPRD